LELTWKSQTNESFYFLRKERIGKGKLFSADERRAMKACRSEETKDKHSRHHQ